MLYVPTLVPSALLSVIPKSSPSTTVPLVTSLVNSFSSSPYTLDLLSIVTVTSLCAIV